jgi:hypothetical protein
MPTVATSRKIEGLSPSVAYESLLELLPELGYEIWKTRPLGWLVMANCELPEGKLNATLTFPPGIKTVLSISLASEAMEHAALQQKADELAESLVTLLTGESG